MKAYLKNYRQSPRKVRLVADLIRGKKVDRAMIELKALNKRASDAFIKLVKSATANAQENFKADANNLFIKEVTVDQGVTLKRYRPRARGSASRINKRTSNIKIALEQK